MPPACPQERASILLRPGPWQVGAWGMGSASSKAEAAALKQFDPDEVDALRTDFARVAAFKPDPTKIDPHSLECELQLGHALCERLFARMQELGSLPDAPGRPRASLRPLARTTSKRPSKEPEMDLACLALAVRAIDGFDREEQIDFWLAVVAGGDDRVPAAQCQEFLTAFIQHALPDDRRHDQELRDRLVQVSLNEATERAQSASGLSSSEVRAWLTEEREAREFFSNLLRAHFLRVPDADGVVQEVKHKLPQLGRRSKLLKDEHLWVLSPYLPENCLRKPWKRLFCSIRHGQSFAAFMSRMVFKGPTVFVIKDSGGHVFGGFAPVSWHKSNQFYGSSRAFLFSLAPKMRVFATSGYNNNYMWMSTNLTSCNNGLGMGGQKDFWGIFVDTNLEKGECRAPCSTFDKSMPCLSSEVTFEVAQVEVWGCIPGYVADEKELEAAGVKRKVAKTFEEYQAMQQRGTKSALDGNLEAKAIMEAAGIGGHSTDIREADAVRRVSETWRD